MSRALQISYKYRNNKTRMIGMFNPSRNYTYSENSRIRLREVYMLYILPNMDKFKDTVRVIEYVDGKIIYDRKIDIYSANRFIEIIIGMGGINNGQPSNNK